MTFSISGNAGIAFAQVVLGLTSTAKTTADASGNYSFSGLAAGAYMVFPQLYGYGFSPSGSLVTIASANLTGVNFTATASPTPLGIWNKLGLIIPNFALEPSILYEGNAQILSGNVFKMWYLGSVYSAPNIYYAESSDGVNWTQYSSNPVIASANSGRVFKHGSTYIGYYENGFSSFNQYTSTDGINWTLAHAAVLVKGSAGQWDDSQIYNMQVVEIDGNGTWHAVYGGNRANNMLCTGHATSPDGVTWTKDAANPIIQNFSSTQVLKVGSTFYAWGDVTLYNAPSSGFEFPTTFGRCSSTDLENWTTPVASLAPSTVDEVGGAANGGWELDSPAIIEVNGKTYFFYGATNAGGGATQGQIFAAVANGPLSAVVGVAAEGVIGPGVSLVQESHNYAFASTGSLIVPAFGKNVTKNNLMLAWCNSVNPNGTPTDTLASEWFHIGIASQSGGFGTVSLWGAYAKSTGANTVTFGSTGNFAAGQAIEVAGVLVGLLGAAQAGGTGTAPTVNIRAQILDFVFACFGIAGSATTTPGAGFTPADGVATAGHTGIYDIPAAGAVIAPAATMAPSGGWGIIATAIAASLVAFPLGNPDNPALPYIGCVSIAGSDAGGTEYVGHVHVITGARSGVPNPYLGKMFIASAPAGAADNLLGEVTVVAGPPAGYDGTDVYMGHLNEE